MYAFERGSENRRAGSLATLCRDPREIAYRVGVGLEAQVRA